MKRLCLVLTGVLISSMTMASEPIRVVGEFDNDNLASLSFYLSEIERETVGFSTFFTRRAMEVQTYDEYMTLYPLIVQESEQKHNAYSLENVHYLENIPPTAATCAFSNIN